MEDSILRQLKPGDKNFSVVSRLVREYIFGKDEGKDLFNPIMFGSSQIGDPLTQGDLDIDSGKDFNNHPLLGDLEGIHPQLTNQLYNNGTLPLLGSEPLDVNQYSEVLEFLK